MLEFGIKVLYRVAQRSVGGEMEPWWLEGIGLGKIFSSEAHGIGLPSGKVARDGTVRAHPGLEFHAHLDVEFDLDLWNRLCGTPWLICVCI